MGRKNCQVTSLTERTYESVPGQHKTRSMLFRGTERQALIRGHRKLLMVVQQAAVPLSRSCLPPSHEVSVVRGRGVLEFSRNTSSPERSTPRRAQTGFSASLWNTKNLSFPSYIARHFAKIQEITPVKVSDTVSSPLKFLLLISSSEITINLIYTIGRLRWLA